MMSRSRKGLKAELSGLEAELAKKDAIIEELRKNAPKKTVVHKVSKGASGESASRSLRTKNARSIDDLVDEMKKSVAKSVISTDAIIDTALEESDSDIPDDCDPKLRAFLLKCTPDPQRNYFDLDSDDEDDEDDDEDDEDDGGQVLFQLLD